MDSSPKRSPEDVIAHLPEYVRDGVTEALNALLPNLELPLAEAVEHFLSSEKRLTEGISLVAAIEEPDEKKMGMAISALLLRAREVAARWRAFESGVDDLLTVWTPPADLRFPADYFSRRTDIERLPLAVPEWDVPSGEWLRDGCDAIMNGWFNSGRLAIAITAIPDPACRLTFLVQIAEEFRLEAWPALSGEEGLLKLLPKLHEENSGRIYREEFLSDG